jgi:dual specificity protein kinase YAK1
LETIASVADQLLKALSILDASTIIHADLKPENILLMKPYRGDEEKGLQIKLADFGSAVVGFEKHSAPYIQSRYYRAPEAIVGVPFTSAIDMWSLGCILCELFIARPIFPGQSECEQIYIITRALRSDIPKEILRKGLKTNNFFEFIKGRFCVKRSRKWKSMASPVEHFDARLEREFEGRTKSDEDKKSKNRFKGFVHFVRNLLDIDPDLRWNPFEARQHPFLSGQIFRDSFIPSSETSSSKAQHSIKIQVPKVRSISLENQRSNTNSIVT